MLFFLVVQGCSNDVKRAHLESKRSHPSHVYNFVDADTTRFKYVETDYLPVYSAIYYLDGTRRFPITTTVSIRNTSLNDSAWILSAVYYDSYGKILNSYFDSVLLLVPLESVELVVEEKDNEGGAGANFVIKWGTPEFTDQLLIQSVMIGTYGQQGVSFLSNAKIIQQEFRK